MRVEIRKGVGSSKTLDEVRDHLFEVFEEVRDKGINRIGYVSGAVTADGPDKIKENISILEDVTSKVREDYDYPVFCASDVFSDELFKKLDAAGYVNADWEVFWQEVLESEKKYVTDMFMSPGWERSHGAKEELESAKKIGMNIHILQ